MVTLLSFVEGFDFLPLFLAPIIFLAVVAVIIVAVVKKSNAEKRQREINRQNSRMTDGNGRTQQQRDYLNAKRRELSERKINSSDGSHEHLGGKVEKYDKIVGSLGEVNDEGCDELDGVRLVEHDESYCDDPEHIAQADMSELQQAIVLGEVLNNPRFVNPYKKK